MEIGSILAQLRNQKNLNQREFAHIMGVSNGAVAMWETNKRQPDLEMLKKIANYYEIPADFLLGIGTFENWNVLLENKPAVLHQISIQAQQLALNIKDGVDDITFAKLVYAFDIRITTNEDGEIGISGKDPIPTYTENYFFDAVGMNDDEKKMISLYRSATNEDKRNIMDLLNSFCVLQERKNKIMALGRCLELEEAESVAADKPVKKAGTTHLAKQYPSSGTEGIA